MTISISSTFRDRIFVRLTEEFIYFLHKNVNVLQELFAESELVSHRAFFARSVRTLLDHKGQQISPQSLLLHISCEDQTLIFQYCVGQTPIWFKHTMQRRSQRSESCCSATCCRPRCRNICPWFPGEWWSGLWRNPRIPTGWFSAGSCP